MKAHDYKEPNVEFQEHSGQMFDWWRSTSEGRIIKKPKAPSPPPLVHSKPRRTDQMCWPMYQDSRFDFQRLKTDTSKSKADLEECSVSKEFWPNTSVRMVKKNPLEHQRPPWRPTLNPTSNFPSVGHAPPHPRCCESRQKPVIPFVSRP